MNSRWQYILAPTFAVFLMAAGGAVPSLVDAARHGDKSSISALLQKKADVNSAAADGTTALQWAAYHNDLESIDMLLRAGANPNAANDLGVTPLWNASQNGSAAVVKRLLDAGAKPNLALLSGETPLMVAARSGYPDVVELLLAKGANPNLHGTRGQTALMWAVSQKHPAAVKVLLAHGSDIQARSDVYNEVMAVPPHGYLPYNRAIPHGGDTALLFAARVGDLESLKLLVAAGANVNDVDAWGVSAVTLAAHSGFDALVEFLLDKGANPNVEGPGFTALHEAIMRRDEKMVAALLAHGADPNLPLKTWTPTRRSSDDWHFEPSLVGATPLWLAARFTEPNVMKILVQQGADPKFVLHSEYVAERGFGQAPSKENVTALMAATGMIRVYPWVDIPDKQAESLMLESVKLLVDWEVEVNAANTDGRNALDAARSLHYKTVIDYLISKGAKSDRPVQPGRPRPRF